MIVVFIYPFTIILAHTALHVLHHKQGTWVKPLATWILRSGVGYLDTRVCTVLNSSSFPAIYYGV